MLKVVKLPAKVPKIKLEPEIKDIGTGIVSNKMKFTLLLYLLFWILINKKIKRVILNKTIKVNFLIKNFIWKCFKDILTIDFY